MNRFTITDIENLTGIKAHTLRVWEQRYQLNLCQRKDGGHRFYDSEDLKKILRIAVLYKKGFRISEMASLSNEQLIAYTLQEQYRGEQEQAIHQLLEAVMAFDQEKFNEIFHRLVVHMGLEKVMLTVVYPLLNLIGKRWLTDRLVPAQEHFCSELIIKKILLATDGLDTVLLPGRKNLVVFTPLGETHEIPVLFMHYLLKKNGHHSVYIGKNLPLEIVLEYCFRHPPSHLYFHLITQLGPNNPVSYLKELQKSLPAAKIVCSGPGISPDIAASIDTIKCLKDAAEMMQFARSN